MTLPRPLPRYIWPEPGAGQPVARPPLPGMKTALLLLAALPAVTWADGYGHGGG